MSARLSAAEQMAVRIDAAFDQDEQEVLRHALVLAIAEYEKAGAACAELPRLVEQFERQRRWAEWVLAKLEGDEEDMRPAVTR